MLEMACTSTGLKASGHSQKGGWQSSTAARKTSNFTSKNVSGDGIKILILCIRKLEN
jgi:hypothetical protein